MAQGGTLAAHGLSIGRITRRGFVNKEFPTKVQDCDKCREYYFANPMLIGAFASVGIEHGKSTWEMAESYFAEFHKNKHKTCAALERAAKGGSKK